MGPGCLSHDRNESEFDKVKMRSDNSMSAKYAQSSVPSCKVLNIPLKKDSLSICNFRVRFPTSPIWKSKNSMLVHLAVPSLLPQPFPLCPHQFAIGIKC